MTLETSRHLHFVYNLEEFELHFVSFGGSLKSIEYDKIDSHCSKVLAFLVV